MKKLMLITLLGTPIGSAWGAEARPELEKAPLSARALQIANLKMLSHITDALGQFSKTPDAGILLKSAREYANNLNDAGRGLSWVNLAESAFDETTFNSKKFYEQAKPALLQSEFPGDRMDEIMLWRNFIDEQ